MEAPALQTPWASHAGREPFFEVDLGPNRVSVLKDGLQAYPAMLNAIAGAKRTIALETYILRDDTMGLRFLHALVERAEAGVEVLLMYDYWGSSLSEESVAKLREAGVKTLVFHPLRWTGSLGRFLVHFSRRNHRKALVVDGDVGFTGGLNVSDDYAAVEDGGKGWRDTHVRIVGPAAAELEQLFLKTWRTHRGPAFDGARFERPKCAGSWRIRVLGSDFSQQRKDIRRAYLEAFERSARTLFLTHAYFVPPSRVVKAMVRAAKRGVRVAVILGAATDVKLALYAARGLYRKLLKAGVEVYEWNGRVLHAKTAVVDGRWCTIGSSNLDPMSLRHNLEVNAVFEDAELGQALERMFAADLTHCERITWKIIDGYGLFHRLAMWFAARVRAWL